MDKKTLKITTGAAVIAIFVLMLLINRQTGMMFEEVILYLYPIPMVTFAVQYGWKNSLPVLFAMACFAFLFGTFTSIFYAVSFALIGLIFGDCIYRKADMTRTLLVIMALCALVNILDVIVLAGIVGVDLNQEIDEMQTMVNNVFAQAGVAVPEGLLSRDYLRQMMVIGMAVVGILQGFVIFEITLLLLRRLRFQVQKPKSIYLYYPPKWTGIVGVVLFLIYYGSVLMAVPDSLLKDIIQVGGICGILYLSCFGLLAIMFFGMARYHLGRGIRLILCFILYFSMPMIIFLAGLFYVMTDYHRLYADDLMGERR